MFYPILTTKDPISSIYSLLMAANNLSQIEEIIRLVELEVLREIKTLLK